MGTGYLFGRADQVARKKLALRTGFLLCITVMVTILGSSFVQATGVMSPYWTERRPVGDTDQNWHAVATNENGSRSIAAVYGGRLYITANGGTTWTETQPAGDVDKDWRTVASDADGSVLVAAVLSGHVYVSTDSGDTWEEHKPSGFLPRLWTSATVSAEGSKIAVSSWGLGIVPGRVYISDDSGDTWDEAQPTGSSSSRWARIEMSADGSTILAGREDGRLYVSTDGGDTWSETQPAGDNDGTWYAFAVSGTGSRLVAASQGGRVYISNNSGDTWTETRPAGDEGRGWTSASISSNGNKIIIGTGVDDRNGMFVSENFGTSWRETHPAGPEYEGSWRTAMSGDGNYVVAGSYDGRLFTGYLWNQSASTDTNNDGIPDDEQANVWSVVAPSSSKVVGMELDENCTIETMSLTQESSADVQDAGYDYAQNLVNFDADCGDPGYTTTVKIYFHGVENEGMVVRKYNPHTNAYFTVSGAVLTEQTINGQSVTVATYQITDGGVLDIDGVANGLIVDPVGLASQAVSTPNTGFRSSHN